MTGRAGTERQRHGVAREIVTVGAIGAVYYVAARYSLRLALVEENVTPFWPPTGIAVVGVLLFGLRVVPAIAVAAFLVNLPISPSGSAAATIAVGNTLAPVAAATLLSATRFRADLGRLRDALLLLVAALASTLISASVGTATLNTSGVIPSSDAVESFAVWWTGDAMGVLIVAPLLLALRAAARPDRLRPARVVEAIALAAAIVGASLLLVVSAPPVYVLVFPPLAWVAWRFGLMGAAVAVFWVSTVATWAAVNQRGIFAGAGLVDDMLALQAFNTAVSFTALFLAAMVTERLSVLARRHSALERDRELQLGLYEREREVAETLQRSLLPQDIPDSPDLAIVARYVPAGSGTAVGGDWYDVTPMRDGRVAVAIGDVAGHGLQAAATMGQVRMALRAYALETLSPAAALDRLNALLHQLRIAVMTTVLNIHIDPWSGDLRISNAGHLPPLLIRADGTRAFIDGRRSPPVGVGAHVSFEETTARLEPGDTMLLFTDGLIETRDEAIDIRLEALRAVADPTDGLEQLCDRVLGLAGDPPADDVAVLAVRRVILAGRPLEIRRPAEPTSATEIRHVLRRWLTENAVPDGDVYDILLASGEATANAIQHAYRQPGEGEVSLRAERQGDEVAVWVADAGSWRAPRDGDGSTGRGLVVIGRTMDTVDVEKGRHGTTVAMRRTLRRADQLV